MGMDVKKAPPKLHVERAPLAHGAGGVSESDPDTSPADTGGGGPTKQHGTVLGGPAQKTAGTAAKGKTAADVRALDAQAEKVAKLLPQMLCDLGGVDDLAKLGVRPLVASAGKDSLFNCLFGRDSIRM